MEAVAYKPFSDSFDSEKIDHLVVIKQQIKVLLRNLQRFQALSCS